MAESGGNFATTLGNGMATLYLNQRTGYGEVTFEGGGAFPVKITDGGRNFIVLNGEGAVSWHDNQTGKLLAVFRLYQDFWTLEKNEPFGPGREILRGGVINARGGT